MSIRKKLIYISMIVLGITNTIYAQEIPFVFDKNKIDIGTMYIYEYSTKNEGFEPKSKGYLYIKTLTDIEVVWAPIATAKASLLEKYTLNWNYMMLEKKEFLSLKDRDKIVVNETYKSVMEVDYSKKIIKLNGTNKQEDGFKEFNTVTRLSKLPTYFYRLTDLLELWFVLRFYPNDKKEISVNHNADGYNSELIIKYMGKEEVEVPYGKIKCNKFELTPKLNPIMRLLSKTKDAHIWLASDENSGYMVKYRNDNYSSTFTRSMEYRLTEIRKMSMGEWEDFKQRSVLE